MDEKQAVYWHQGMFLQPQHFQLAELNQRFQAKPMLESGLPHFWGVGELTLAQAAIANRSIEVESAQLLFPDRTYVEYPGNAVIRERRLDTAVWGEGDKPLTVYLGLRKLSTQESNVTEVASMAEAGAAATRFASLGNPPQLADLYSNGPRAEVRTLLHVIQIFFEHEIDNLQGYELIPVAQLVRDVDTVRLSPTFIPPCYALAGSEVLTRVFKDIRDELAGRARQLQEYKSPRELQKAEFDPDHIVFLLALRSLNRASPHLFHLSESTQAHPWLVYGALRQLVGELSSFSEQYNMLGEGEDGSPALPAYDHTDLGKCFTRVYALLGKLLNEITVGPEFLAPMEPRDGLYVAELPQHFFGQRNRFYLVLRTGREAAAVLDAVRQDVRLAAAGEIGGLIAHALPGLELIHLSAAPQGLPRRAQSYYFRIEQMSQQWDTVERQGTIALQWMDAPDDLKADIVILRR